MVGIGIVGLGYMGATHFRAIRRIRGARVVAICTRDRGKLRGDWRGIGGNLGIEGGRENLKGVRTYTELAEMLGNPEVDLIDVCLPTSLHPVAARVALASGKHVLVEKPIALDWREASRLLAEARRVDRVLMVAHVLPYFPEYAYLRKLVSEETYGPLLAAHFRRTVSRRSPAARRENLGTRGGPVLDLHVHDTHFIDLLCGAPDRVWSSGRMLTAQHAEYISTIYRYDGRPNLCVTCASGAISQVSRGFAQGFEVHLESATVLYESSAQPLTVYSGNRRPRCPGMGDPDPLAPFIRELRAAVRAAKGGRVPPELSGERAAAAIRLCASEVASLRRGRAVSVRPRQLSATTGR